MLGIARWELGSSEHVVGEPSIELDEVEKVAGFPLYIEARGFWGALLHDEIETLAGGFWIRWSVGKTSLGDATGMFRRRWEFGSKEINSLIVAGCGCTGPRASGVRGFQVQKVWYSKLCVNRIRR
jgi:hypothetical protein